jgi:hypothetical protein
VSSAPIVELMEHFVSAALGLDVVSRIGQPRELPAHHKDSVAKLQCKGRIWAAWSTNIGPVIVSAEYDHAQAQSMKAHVLYFEWWIEPGESHGRYWWHCYPKRPREWIAGRGRL